MTHLMKLSGLLNVKDTKAELQVPRINRNNTDVLEIMSKMDNFMNPFNDIEPNTPLIMYWTSYYGSAGRWINTNL